MATDNNADGREPMLARRSPFAPAAKLCPKCLSPLTTYNKDMMGIIPSEYYCPKCGYSGSVFLEKEPESDKGTK